MLHEIIDINEQLGGTPFVQWILELAAALEVAEKAYVQAAQLYGTAEALSEVSGRRRDAADDVFVTSIVKQIREALGNERFDASVRDGHAIAPGTALKIAVEISRHH
jgi:hypothetical protein